jgi:hypothetical protein
MPAFPRNAREGAPIPAFKSNETEFDSTARTEVHAMRSHLVCTHSLIAGEAQ